MIAYFIYFLVFIIICFVLFLATKAIRRGLIAKNENRKFQSGHNKKKSNKN